MVWIRILARSRGATTRRARAPPTLAERTICQTSGTDEEREEETEEEDKDEEEGEKEKEDEEDEEDEEEGEEGVRPCFLSGFRMCEEMGPAVAASLSFCSCCPCCCEVRMVPALRRAALSPTPGVIASSQPFLSSDISSSMALRCRRTERGQSDEPKASRKVL